MKVLLLTGSPRRAGNSNALATAFCRGLAENDHSVTRFDAAEMTLHPCVACGACRREGSGGKCCRQDDMQAVYPHLLEAEAVVLATPVYYYTVSAQLKMMIDRFYAVNAALRERPKQAFLLAACMDRQEADMQALLDYFQRLCDYCHWQNQGHVLATGLGEVGEAEHSPFLQAAYEAGKRFA